MKWTNKKVISIASLLVLIGFIVGYFTNSLFFQALNYQNKRNEIMKKIELIIETGEKTGEYDCCFEPGCEMCIFGDFIWENGECHCMEMMRNGEMDKVCPECIDHGCGRDFCPVTE